MYWIIQLICSSLLFLLGWHRLDTEKVFTKRRVIHVFSHTTYWDFFFMVLYAGAYQQYFTNIYTIMKPQPFRLWGWFLHRINCIPATRAEDKSDGFVMKTAKFLSDKEHFMILISPEGKCDASAWRSGYYYLAQELQCGIQVVGFDFHLKTYVSYPMHSNLGLKEELEPILMEEMSGITPLYPEKSYTKARFRPDYPITIYDSVFTSLIIGTIIALYYVYAFDKISFLAGGTSTFISILYHYNQENNPLIQWIDMKGVIIALTIYLFRLWQFGKLSLTVEWCLGLLITFSCYYKGSGRVCCSPRTYNYIVYHSLYHLGLAWCVMYPVMGTT